MIVNRYITQRFIVQKILKFSPRREIKEYSILLIGENCPQALSVFENNKETSLDLLSPGRSLEASYQIFLHTVSILKEGGQCFIFDGDRMTKTDYTLFDVRFFSQLTIKQMGLNRLYLKSLFPLFFEPLRSIRLLLNLSKGNYQQAQCEHQGIIELCSRKHIQLHYYKKTR